MSPKGHFCTLSLLRRNQAASWEEPQPGEGEPHTLAMPCRRCGSGRTQPPPPPAWHCLPIPSDPTPDPPTGGPRPRHGGDQERWNTPKGKGGGGKKSQSQATKKKKERRKRKENPLWHLLSADFSAEHAAASSNKGFCSPCREEGAISLHSEHVARWWNTAAPYPAAGSAPARLHFGDQFV